MKDDSQGFYSAGGSRSKQDPRGEYACYREVDKALSPSLYPQVKAITTKNPQPTRDPRFSNCLGQKILTKIRSGKAERPKYKNES